MKWNYRVCVRPSSGFVTMQIHEVYYDKYGMIEYYSKNPIAPLGDDERELFEDMTLMMNALDKAVLNLDHLDRMFKQKKLQDKRKENKK